MMNELQEETIPLTFEGREEVIENGQRTFVRVGLAIAAIRRDRQYIEAGYKNFDVYCRERWGWSKARAHQLEQAAALVDKMAGEADPDDLPTTERQARELGKVDESERAEKMKAAKEKAESEGRDEPTADDIREAANETSEPEQVAESLVDDEGHVVPDDLADVFGEQCDLYDEAAALTKRVMGLTSKIEKLPAGSWNNPGSGMRRQAGALSSLIKGAKPAIVCRACNGEGGKCGDCHGRKYICSRLAESHLKKHGA